MFGTRPVLAQTTIVAEKARDERPAFRLHDVVRLRIAYNGFPQGTRGRIVGEFTASKTYLVSFEAEGTCVADVRYDKLVASEAPAGR